MASTTQEAITTLANDSLPENDRKAAVRFLQYNSSTEGTTALVDALRDRDSGVRWACSTALSMLGDDALMPLLRAIGSTDNDAMLREGAQLALVHSSSPEVRKKTRDLQLSLIGPGAELASMEAAAELIMQG